MCIVVFYYVSYFTESLTALGVHEEDHFNDVEVGWMGGSWVCGWGGGGAWGSGAD